MSYKVYSLDRFLFNISLFGFVPVISQILCKLTHVRHSKCRICDPINHCIHHTNPIKSYNKRIPFVPFSSFFIVRKIIKLIHYESSKPHKNSFYVYSLYLYSPSSLHK